MTPITPSTFPKIRLCRRKPDQRCCKVVMTRRRFLWPPFGGMRCVLSVCPSVSTVFAENSQVHESTETHPCYTLVIFSECGYWAHSMGPYGPLCHALSLLSLWTSNRCGHCGHRFYTVIHQVSLMSHAACAIAIAGFGSSW